MVSMYLWQKIRMMRENKQGIKAIARTLKLSRNTVKKYLRSAEPPVFQKREYARKIAPYEGRIVEMVRKRYIGTRIYEELVAEGYRGSLKTLYNHLSRIRSEEREKARSTVRMETGPGEQMQYDWTEWEIDWGGTVQTVYIHAVVLGYSRLTHFSCSATIRQEDVMKALERAFAFFGGTCRTLLMDNGSQMVVENRKEKGVRFNESFLMFCGLYGIEPEACQPYRARTKGKVERTFFSLKERGLRGKMVSDWGSLENLLQTFTRTFNQRRHQTLHEKPVDRFEHEKSLLRPLVPVDPRRLYEGEIRKVSSDGYIRWDGHAYPVPMRFCGRSVWVTVESGIRLTVWGEGETPLLTHPLRTGSPDPLPPHPEHQEAEPRRKKRREGLRARWVGRFRERFGEEGEPFLEGLQEATGPNFTWHVSEIVELLERYDPEEGRRVLREAQACQGFHKNFLRPLLRPECLLPVPEGMALPMGASLTRSLDCYGGLGEEVCHD